MDFSAKMLRDDALKGKVIVVTGGGSGLGKAMTKYFLELGANVAITSRDLDKLKATASELESATSGKCLPLQCVVLPFLILFFCLPHLSSTFCWAAPW